MLRRYFVTNIVTGGTLAGLAKAQEQQRPGTAGVFIEKPASGQPHKGKVLLALQAHSDDIPLSASGTVAKLIEEGYTGYLVRASNDDMGDAPGLGTPGPHPYLVGVNEGRAVLDSVRVARALPGVGPGSRQCTGM